MRRYEWLTPMLGLTVLGLCALAFAWAAGSFEEASTDQAQKLGQGKAYETLAKTPVLHQGRIKPLDTLARETVKQIFGRETIKLKDEHGVVTETWGPVAALCEWSIRPEFWDDQPIILAEYVPLKRFILADAIQTTLGKIETKSKADREALNRLASDKEISVSAIHEFLAGSSLSAAEKKPIAAFAAQLSEEHKWLTPQQLETAQVIDDSGQKLEFRQWFGTVVRKKRAFDANPSGAPKLSEVEKRGYEVGTRLVHYEAQRDRKLGSVEPIQIMPRPTNPDYLKYTGEAFKKAQEQNGTSALTPFELDSANAYYTYSNELPADERKLAGTDAAFDKGFAAWLRDSSVWVPLKVILDSKPEELVKAGYPSSKLSAFLAAFKGLEQAEDKTPGKVDEASTSSFLAAARGLGDSLNPTIYPTVTAIDRETKFNAMNPFWMAWPAYLCATLLLGMSLGFFEFPKPSAMAATGRVVYGLGMLALVGGIGFEVLGFYYRIRISGWAPVTNTYETVIWVSLVSAVLGLIFEAKFQRAYTALGGSAVALLGTALAANVPLLDPHIGALQPVLRSQYWLVIHVLTEVSSYGAFLLAAVLGLMGTMYYITATYRRAATYTGLGLLLVPGLPLLAVGTAGLMASNGRMNVAWATTQSAYISSAALFCAGLMLSLGSLIGMLGESLSRLMFVEDVSLDTAAIAGENGSHAVASAARNATAVRSIRVGEGNDAGAVATLTKPTVAEIRELATANRVKLDGRGRAMQETAGKIKPLSNFVYRAMQVGVLLIAAGTFLGGWWADESWGRFWGWDPKEVWALITLLVYLIPLHGRFAGWINMFALVTASVVCSLSVIMAWYGVNFVLGVGLHSYGFVEGGGQLSVFAVLSAMLAFPVAAAWRRHLAMRPVTMG